MRAAQTIMFDDYDNDGDLDLFISGIDYFDSFDSWEDIHYFLEYQENVGDKWNPHFAPRTSIFEQFPFPLGYFFPSAGDVNDDDRTDFIVNSIVDFIGNRTSTYLRNTGEPGSDQFEVTLFDQMGLTAFVPESFFVPELIDLDLDGDLDILMSGFDPAFAEEDGPDVPKYYYAKNIGNPSEPEFLGWFEDPYGLLPNPFVEILTGGDIDNDGDIDLLGTTTVIPPDSMNHIYVHLNTPGFDEKPSFTNTFQSPFGLTPSFGEAQYLFPELVDIDGDGDEDLFVFLGGTDSLTLQYYENNLCMLITNVMVVDLCDGDIVEVGGVPYAEAGNYEIVLQDANGCDSIIQLTINILPLPVLDESASICAGETYIIGNDSFTVAGDYTVYVTAANGCDSIIYLSLIVNEVYEVGVNQTICEGDTYLIGGNEFNQPGNYSVTLQSQAGCDSTILLALSVVTIDTTVTINENTLTANMSDATYQWFDCDSGENIPFATDQAFTATSTGNYAVSITNYLNCTEVSGCNMIVISGINETNYANSITVYPNPNTGMIYIRNNSSYPVSTVTVMNLAGQSIGTFLLDDRNSADISQLGKGFFILKIRMEGVEVVKRLIVI